MTIWGDQLCNRHVLKQGEVLGVKSARISDYGGKSLNVSSDHATLFPNLKHSSTNALQAWAQSAGDFENIRCLTETFKKKDNFMNEETKNDKKSNLHVSDLLISHQKLFYFS